MELEEMKTAIYRFIDEYWGTAIGESIYRKTCNVGDYNYEGFENIYNELEELGYL